jgi:IS1 family transposase
METPSPMTSTIGDLWPTEAQLDELWSFLKNKNKNLNEVEKLEAELGDGWVWVAFDPESKVVLGFVLGKTQQGSVHPLAQARARGDRRGVCPLFTSDELSMYEDAILQVFGKTIQPERQRDRGRFPKPRHVPRKGLVYATVHKQSKEDAVVEVSRRGVLGTEEAADQRLAESVVSEQVTTSFVEHQNGTLRQGAAQWRRKVLSFSKNGDCFR